MGLSRWKRCGNTMFWQDIDPKSLHYDNMTFLDPMTLTKVITASSGYAERPDIAEPFQDGYMSVISERLPFLYESVARAGARLVVGPSQKLQEDIVQEATSWVAYLGAYREEGLTDREIARIFLEKWSHQDKSEVLAGIKAAFYGHGSPPLIMEAWQEEELQESEAWKQEEEDYPGVIVDTVSLVLIRKGSAAHRMVDQVIRYERPDEVILIDALEEGVWDVLAKFGIPEC